MAAVAKKIAILIESDYYEKEIFYYEHRFAEEGFEVHWLSRLWGQPSLTFFGHEWKVPFECRESFEQMSDDELRSYSAVIVPSGIVGDRLRYTEDIDTLAPATLFMKRAFAEPGIIKGIICHGMWLVAAVPELVRGRPVVAHVNLLGDVRNMGAIYTDQDVVVDRDLVTARTGNHCHQFAQTIIGLLHRHQPAVPLAFHHVAISCQDPQATERFYVRHFGFTRVRAIPIDGGHVVFLRNGDAYLELFPAEGTRPVARPEPDGPHFPGLRHLAFKVDDVAATLAAMGNDARVTLGPLDFDAVIPGWRTAWVADPDGNIVEISQGYRDQEPVPALA